MGFVVDLDHARQSGITITLADLNYAEMLILRILAEEREKYSRELNEKALRTRK